MLLVLFRSLVVLFLILRVLTCMRMVAFLMQTVPFCMLGGVGRRRTLHAVQNAPRVFVNFKFDIMIGSAGAGSILDAIEGQAAADKASNSAALQASRRAFEAMLVAGPLTQAHPSSDSSEAGEILRELGAECAGTSVHVPVCIVEAEAHLAAHDTLDGRATTGECVSATSRVFA